MNLVVVILKTTAPERPMNPLEQPVDGFPDFGNELRQTPIFVRYAEAYGVPRETRVKSRSRISCRRSSPLSPAAACIWSTVARFAYCPETPASLVDEVCAKPARPTWIAPEAEMRLNTARRPRHAAVVQAFDRNAPWPEIPRTDDAGLAWNASAGRPSAPSRDRDGLAEAAPPHCDPAQAARLKADQSRDHLALQIAREGGKPRPDAIVENDPAAIDCVHKPADELRTSGGREIPMGLSAAAEHRWAFMPPGSRSAICPAAISAFNHPLNLIGPSGRPRPSRWAPGHRQAGGHRTPPSCRDFRGDGP